MVGQALQPQRMTVWCAFWGGSMIGPYIFEYFAGPWMTVDGFCYRMMFTDFFWPEIDAMNVEDVYF